MKNFYTRVFVLCFFISSSSLHAQQQGLFREPDRNRSTIFQQLPDTLAFQPEKFLELLERKIGDQVQLSFASDARMNMSGQIVSIISKYENQIQSIVFRSDDQEEKLIVFSKIRSDQEHFAYRGYIRGKESADLYILKNNNGLWQWIKIRFNDLVNE